MEKLLTEQDWGELQNVLHGRESNGNMDKTWNTEIGRCSEYLPDDNDYSKLEKIPSDADSSEESEESTRGNNSEQEGDLDLSVPFHSEW
jgi:hypothetical protein